MTNDTRTARTMAAVLSHKYNSCTAEPHHTDECPAIVAAAIADQDAWAEQVCAPLVALLRRFSEESMRNDCVKFGRHEYCSLEHECAYRLADAALAAYREGKG